MKKVLAAILMAVMGVTSVSADDIFDDDEKVVRELLKFLESAFTFSHSDVKKLEK